MTKDEKAYLKMLEYKRDDLSIKINRLQAEKQTIVQEIIKIETGQYEWKQLELEEVNSM